MQNGFFSPDEQQSAQFVLQHGAAQIFFSPHRQNGTFVTTTGVHWLELFPSVKLQDGFMDSKMSSWDGIHKVVSSKRVGFLMIFNLMFCSWFEFFIVILPLVLLLIWVRLPPAFDPPLPQHAISFSLFFPHGYYKTAKAPLSLSLSTSSPSNYNSNRRRGKKQWRMCVRAPINLACMQLLWQICSYECLSLQARGELLPSPKDCWENCSGT